MVRSGAPLPSLGSLPCWRVGGVAELSTACVGSASEAGVLLGFTRNRQVGRPQETLRPLHCLAREQWRQAPWCTRRGGMSVRFVTD